MVEARSYADLSAAAERVRRRRRYRSERSRPRACAKLRPRPRPARRRRRRRSNCSRQTYMRMEAGRGGTDVSGRRSSRHRAGNGARQSRRVPWRGHREGGRRVQGDRRALREVRAAARSRHADFRAGDSRRGDGGGDDGSSAYRRDHVRRLPRRVFRLRRQRNVEDSLHDERSVVLPAGDPHRQRRRRTLRRAAFAVDRELDDDDPGREGRRAVFAR